MAEQNGASRPGDGTDRHHFKRIFTIWIVLAVIADVLFGVFAYPHMPPGRMTSAAGGAQFDFNVLFLAALPVVIAIWVYLGYAIVNWRASRVPNEPVNTPASAYNFRIQTAWIAATTVIVLSLFVFGTVELIVPAGAGGGEGPNPIWNPTSKTVLPIQVIGQQWKWTYRYPTLGGFETDQLMLPANTQIAFHVTSLDVIHDFWAYQLGVKADANPGQDNVAYTKTTQELGSFVVRCDELCGLWHGAMYTFGRILSKSGFEKWAIRTRVALADNTKYLPPFAWTYTPDANGADGGYYQNNVSPYSKIQVYGAQKVKV